MGSLVLKSDISTLINNLNSLDSFIVIDIDNSFHTHLHFQSCLALQNYYTVSYDIKISYGSKLLTSKTRHGIEFYIIISIRIISNIKIKD